MIDKLKSNIVLISIITVLLIVIIVGINYYNSQLQKLKVKNLENGKTELLEKQSKSLDSALKLIPKLRDSLYAEKNKPPIIIPKYNEKIIYKSVDDSAIINAFTRERRKYIQKRER